VSYVDLLLVHWPNPQVALAETMEALALAKRQGLARHVGVANFNIALLDEAIRLCPEPLVNLQVEYHPYLDQTKVLDACRRRGLIMTAYCPLGRGRLIEDPVIGEIARRNGKTAAQVALRWLIQQGNVAPIPRSSNPQRIAQNLDVFGFSLSPEDRQRITALHRADGRIADPAGRAPAWD
jgi:2,5-diketo-D-gluconate reductase B